ncbi:MAG TPA: radical SAM protein [Chloroflexaceae bacterium]|nr:radical SAM protein [Chloroflexaceae bacterium]
MANDLELADLVTPGDDGATVCLACQWRCGLAPGVAGRCLVREGAQGGVALLNHGLIAGAAIGPIEDHRLWHFFPDSLVLAIGGWGYATVADQGRGPYGAVPDDPAKRRKLDADRAATFALERLCRGVVWAFGEPAVNHEYARGLLQLSRAASRYTAIVTTGAMTEEALDQIGHYLDGMSLDLRGFSEASYARLGGLPDWRQVLAVAERARARWGCHLEVTTRVHHGVNDDPDELRALAGWIKERLGEHTPWHVLPGDAGSETAASTMRARRLGHEAGLHHVYGAEPNQPTRCPVCHNTLIARANGVTRLVGLSDGACASCGHEARLHLSIFKQR